MTPSSLLPDVTVPPGTAFGRVLAGLAEDHSRYFPEAPAPPRVLGFTLVPRRLSDIARITLGFGDERLDAYVKIHKKPTSPIERVRTKARLEFEMLTHLHPRFAGIPGCAVARPIAFFPEEIAVVTEAVRGENLHHLLKREARGWPGRDTRARAEAHCRGAGRWLRHFQDITRRPETARVPLDEIRAQVTGDLEACAALGLGRATARTIQGFLDARCAEVGGGEVPVTGEHPDFQPDNVLCSADTVTVIDFTSFRPGTAYSDVARFLAAVAFLGKNPLYRRPVLGGLARAFLEGYGWPAGLRDPALSVYLVRFVVQAVRTAGTWPHRPGVRWLVGRRAAGFLTGWARRVVRAGDGLAGSLAG
jgi:hypothetical protein